MCFLSLSGAISRLYGGLKVANVAKGDQTRRQIIAEFLKAELTEQEVGDKFGIDQKTVQRYKEELGKKINLLFCLNPEPLMFAKGLGGRATW